MRGGDSLSAIHAFGGGERAVALSRIVAHCATRIPSQLLKPSGAGAYDVVDVTTGEERPMSPGRH